MADKKQETAATEKIYTIPLRKSWIAAGRVQRTNKTVRAVRQYVEKHTRASEIKISEKVNSALWAGGAKNALHTIRVKVNLIEDTASVRMPDEISLEDEKKQFLEREKAKKAVSEDLMLSASRNEKAVSKGTKIKRFLILSQILLTNTVKAQ